VGDPRRDRPPEDGGGYFALLAQEPARGLLRELREGPLSLAELQARRGVAERTMRHRLEALERMGLLCRHPLAGDRRATGCALTEAGLELALIMAEIEVVAARHGLGSRLIEVIAERRRRLILRALIDGPRTFTELLRLVPGLTHAALVRDLAALRAVGLAHERGGGRRGASLHEVTGLMAQLRRALLRSAGWRWRWTPHGAPRMAGDLAGLIRLSAPFVALGPTVSGRVELHVVPPAGGMRGWSDVEVSAAAGSISIVEFDAAGKPDARVQGTPLAWCEALCGAAAGGLGIDGEIALAEALLAGLVAALAL